MHIQNLAEFPPFVRGALTSADLPQMDALSRASSERDDATAYAAGLTERAWAVLSRLATQDAQLAQIVARWSAARALPQAALR